MDARRLLVAALVAACLSPAIASADDQREPEITDAVGDANFTMQQGDTRPASYGPADLLSVRFETTYVATPVGADGIDYETTGVRYTFETLEAPGATHIPLAFRLGFDLPACRSTLAAYIDGPVPGGTSPGGERVEWSQQTRGGCPDFPSSHPQQIALLVTPFTVAVEGRTVAVTVPYSVLTPAQRTLFAVGETITAPAADTTLFVGVGSGFPGTYRLWAPVADFTHPGLDFEIGSDVPPDVPCTVGCPAT